MRRRPQPLEEEGDGHHDCGRASKEDPERLMATAVGLEKMGCPLGKSVGKAGEP